jgi:hypothetical protein
MSDHRVPISTGLWEAHLARCRRLAGRARADGWDVPEGAPARVLYVGTDDGNGVYLLEVNGQYGEPIAAAQTDEAGLYAAYVRLLGEAGVARARR